MIGARRCPRRARPCRRPTAWPGLLVALIVLSGCSTREPTNPLDPRHPATGGAPRWLDAFAGDSTIDLTWSVPAYADLEAVVLCDDAGASLWTGSSGRGSWTVAGAPNGIERGFRLELVLREGCALLLPEERAEPGPAAAWAFDAESSTLHRLTPDGRRSRRVLSAPDAALARVDPATGGVLVVDFYAGRVRRLDREGAVLWSAEDFVRPVGALRANAGWWIADPGSGTVSLLDDDGRRVAADSSFTYPVDLAPADSGRVWVADNDGLVALLDPVSGVHAEYRGLAVPDVLAADGEGGAWVADRGGRGIVRIDARGTLRVAATGLDGVVGLAADPLLLGGVWVAARARRAVVLLDGEGNEAGSLGGLASPSACVVSPDGAAIWVADPGAGAVIRFARDGRERSRSRDLKAPTTVTVAFAPGF